MLFMYLDESGDLVFNQGNPNASRHFTICILVVRGLHDDRALNLVVKRSLRRERRRRKVRDSSLYVEYKGSSAPLEAKKRLHARLNGIPFNLYAITIDKHKVRDLWVEDKGRIYNFITRLVVDRIPLDNDLTQVELLVDKSKGKKEVERFNHYITENLKARLHPSVRFRIQHVDSVSHMGIQAVDMYSHGIFKSRESGNLEWLSQFRDRIALDELYGL